MDLATGARVVGDRRKRSWSLSQPCSMWLGWVRQRCAARGPYKRGSARAVLRPRLCQSAFLVATGSQVCRSCTIVVRQHTHLQPPPVPRHRPPPPSPSAADACAPPSRVAAPGAAGSRIAGRGRRRECCRPAVLPYRSDGSQRQRSALPAPPAWLHCFPSARSGGYLLQLHLLLRWPVEVCRH